MLLLLPVKLSLPGHSTPKWWVHPMKTPKTSWILETVKSDFVERAVAKPKLSNRMIHLANRLHTKYPRLKVFATKYHAVLMSHYLLQTKSVQAILMTKSLPVRFQVLIRVLPKVRRS